MSVCLPTASLPLVKEIASVNQAKEDGQGPPQKFFHRLNYSNHEMEQQRRKCPDGYVVKAIDPKFAEMIDEIWPYRQPSVSLDMTRDILSKDMGLGAFNKDDGESLFFSSYSFIIDQITKIF
jgi:hypothetical protein